jgi:hypothetical protein
MGGEIWSVTLKEILFLFENTVLRRYLDVREQK